MNVKDIITTVGDLSLSQLLICQVANQYYKSADYKKNKVGIGVAILKAKDSYLRDQSDISLDFLIRKLSELRILTHLGHAGQHFDLVTKKAGVKSAAPERNFDKLVVIRQEEFMTEVRGFANKYPAKMLEEFGNWWGAINHPTQRMRFEDTPYFETGKRLATWYGKRKNEQQQNNNAILPGSF